MGSLIVYGVLGLIASVGLWHYEVLIFSTDSLPGIIPLLLAFVIGLWIANRLKSDEKKSFSAVYNKQKFREGGYPPPFPNGW